MWPTCDQHWLWSYFDLCQVGRNPWHTMTICGVIRLIIWSARLGQICCRMMHHVAYQSMPRQLPVLPSSHWAPSAPIKILTKLEPCLLDKSHESRIDWTYSSRLWKWCENAGCSTGTQAELDLGSFLPSSWKYFRNFLWLFLCTKHTSGPVLRGPTLLS